MRCRVLVPLLLLLLLFFPCLALSELSAARCRLGGRRALAYRGEADIVIGGIVPVHLTAVYSELAYRTKPRLVRCETFFVEAYQYVLTMVFAIEEINHNIRLLPNTTLGFEIFDSCYEDMKAVECVLRLLSGSKDMAPNYNCHSGPQTAVIIGDILSSATMQVARILGLYRFPQISYGSSLPILSDKLQFPSFLRTAPNSDYQSIGLAQMIAHFGWNWIGIIASNHDFGLSGSLKLIDQLAKRGVCVDFFEMLPMQNLGNRIPQIIARIKKSSAKAIVFYLIKSQVVPLMEALYRVNLTGRVWVAVVSWIVSPVFAKKELWETLHGTIGFSVHRGEIPGLSAFLSSIHPSKYPQDIFIQSFWENVFGCKWPSNVTDTTSESNYGMKALICTGKEVLDGLDFNMYDIQNFRVVYNVYNAVYAVAHGLHHLFSCQTEGPFTHGKCVGIHMLRPWKLLHHIRSVLFTNSAGETMFFDENGDLPAVYDILNWQLLPDGTSRYMKVGMFDSTLPDEQSISINDSAIVWGGGYTQTPASVCSDLCPPGHRKAHLQGQPPCCFDCIPCPMGEISSLGDAAECVKCPDYLWPNGNQDKCIPKHVEFLSYEEPMGAALASISASFSVVTLVIFYIFTKYRDTPLVKANNRGLSYLLLMSLTLCFLCSLIFIGKPRRVTCLLRQVVFGIVFTVCVATVLAKTITVIVVFNATKPGSKLRMWVGPRTPYCIILFCSFIQTIICITWLSTSPPFVDFNMESEAGIITIECNEGSFTMFCCLLGYLGVLSSISFLVAFLARKLPDSFNEAKFITFSMLMFLSVWLLFIPTYLSSKGKYMVAEETFAILSSSSGLLGCIFFPKCYIILLRPERNSKKYLMRKTSS
ncbi:extracellular calcium-sensing receptor-like [Rhinatrema bivittatum]|uniref:extracellular calcium-sensing receptor-like n=1 Tax=Rhinatrema bivittatum TaxID=194408 RepID=UPI00112B592F|nr:extracellular calcium-sensing receptor-like [Rhinatrema bivittatum]